ncbi:MAG: hypothetical protein FJY85_12770 [Deltaproteobacteria bacterium]|nr:hypothetical protein [Deltaproteobacteria bacterium]
MTRTRKNLFIVAIALIVLVGDGVKSYVVARHYVAARYANATNVRLNRICFVGVWMVGFRMDAWHKDAWIQVRVAPLWPGSLGHTSCR